MASHQLEQTQTRSNKNTSWLDKDGDGEISTKELNRMPLFHRAPAKTQELLRELHSKYGKKSILFVISKSDFMSLLSLKESEQVALISKLQRRIIPHKRKKLVGRSARKNNIKKSENVSKSNSNARVTFQSTRKQQPDQRNDFVRGKIGWEDAEADWMRESLDGGLFRSSRKPPAKQRPQGVITSKRDCPHHDHLNCGVPDSVRDDLRRRGVQLPLGTFEIEGVDIHSQLRKTKNTYNKMRQTACTGEESKNCGSFADLTLPGSDRAMRLKRLSMKNVFR